MDIRYKTVAGKARLCRITDSVQGINKDKVREWVENVVLPAITEKVGAAQTFSLTIQNSEDLGFILKIRTVAGVETVEVTPELQETFDSTFKEIERVVPEIKDSVIEDVIETDVMLTDIEKKINEIQEWIEGYIKPIIESQLGEDVNINVLGARIIIEAPGVEQPVMDSVLRKLVVSDASVFSALRQIERLQAKMKVADDSIPETIPPARIGMWLELFALGTIQQFLTDHHVPVAAIDYKDGMISIKIDTTTPQDVPPPEPIQETDTPFIEDSYRQIKDAMLAKNWVSKFVIPSISAYLEGQDLKSHNVEVQEGKIVIDLELKEEDEAEKEDKPEVEESEKEDKPEEKEKLEDSKTIALPKRTVN